MAKKTTTTESIPDTKQPTIEELQQKIVDLENTIWSQRQGQSLLKIEKLEEKINDLNSLIKTLHETLQWVDSEFEFIEGCGCAEKGSSHIESMCSFHHSLLYCNLFFDSKEENKEDPK